MPVLLIVFLLVIGVGWSDVFHGHFGALAYYSMSFTCFLGAAFTLPFVYKSSLKKKVKTKEMTEREAFEKMRKTLGMELTIIAYAWSFDKYFWEDPDGVFKH